MNDKPLSGAPLSFWIIGGFPLIYNLMGIVNFIVQMNSDLLAAMPEQQHAIIESRPAWATIVFTIAVFGATVGCVLLLRKHATAYHIFILSLAGALVTMVHTLRFSGADTTPAGFVIGNLGRLAGTGFLIWYARWTRGKSWIG